MLWFNKHISYDHFSVRIEIALLSEVHSIFNVNHFSKINYVFIYLYFCLFLEKIWMSNKIILLKIKKRRPQTKARRLTKNWRRRRNHPIKQSNSLKKLILWILLSNTFGFENDEDEDVLIAKNWNKFQEEKNNNKEKGLLVSLFC